MADRTSFSFRLAARTLWQEARSEPIDGQRAVAHVLWNRLRAGRWGNTLAAVCHWPEHSPSNLFNFSGWNAHDNNLKPTLELSDDDPILTALSDILEAAETAADPTNGALCYFNPKIAPKPPWAFSLRLCGQFGSQLFYKDNLATGARA